MRKRIAKANPPTSMVVYADGKKEKTFDTIEGNWPTKSIKDHNDFKKSGICFKNLTDSWNKAAISSKKPLIKESIVFLSASVGVFPPEPPPASPEDISTSGLIFFLGLLELLGSPTSWNSSAK